MRHQHAGLAIPDFPLAYGKLWPATDPASVQLYNQHRLELTAVNPITATQVILQMVHRLVALAILGAVFWSAWQFRFNASALRRFRAPRRLAYAWLGLILIQGLLGAATIWSDKAADIATAHVVVGALALALGANLSIIWGRWSRVANAPAAQSLPSPAWPEPSFGAQPSAASVVK